MEETRRAGVYRASGTNPFASPGELSCPVRVRVLVRVSRLGPRLRLRLRSRRVPESSTCRVNSLRSVSAPGPSHTCPFGSTRRCRPRCRRREYGRGPLRCLSSPSRRPGPASIPCLSSVERRMSRISFRRGAARLPSEQRLNSTASSSSPFGTGTPYGPASFGVALLDDHRPSTAQPWAPRHRRARLRRTVQRSTLASCYFALPFTLSCDRGSERVAGLLGSCVLDAQRTAHGLRSGACRPSRKPCACVKREGVREG